MSGKLIYFLRRVDDVGPVKIGCSKQPEQRLATCLIWSPYQLKILCSVPGGFSIERALHLKFSEARLHGEWFEPTDDLLAFIEKVKTEKRLPDIDPVFSKRQEIMASLYRDGQTLGEIGDVFGISRERVRQILRASGIASLGQRDRHKRRRTDLGADFVSRLYSEGHSVSDIAQRCGVSTTKVYNFMREIGLSPKAERAANLQERASRVADLYQRGFRPKQIAEMCGFTHETRIYRELALAGVSPRRAPLSMDLDFDHVKRLYADGLSIQDVARKVNGSRRLIRRYLADAELLRSPEESEALRIQRVVAHNISKPLQALEALEQ